MGIDGAQIRRREKTEKPVTEDETFSPQEDSALKNGKLIQCPACDRLISKNTKACPHCGEPIFKNDQPKSPKKRYFQSLGALRS